MAPASILAKGECAAYRQITLDSLIIGSIARVSLNECRENSGFILSLVSGVFPKGNYR